jgi:hypothetical protein
VPTKRLRCLALLVVAGFALPARAAFAQQWVCYALFPGETAAAAALRIAGDARQEYHERFQILDPSVSKFVAKSRYGRMRAGWLACIWDVSGRPSQLRIAPSPATGVASQPFRIQRAFAEVHPDPLWYLIVLVLLGSWALYRFARGWEQRQAAIGTMTQFGKSVIQEFERPLTQSRDPLPVLRSRLRVKPYRNSLEVLLAPAPGRSYPNLRDHRKNVEYDMERVRRVLDDHTFVSDSMRQRGEWVVLSFRAKGQQKQAGVM